MKRTVLLSLCATLLCGFCLGAKAQTETPWQVTTAITKKNILMEEFTGTGCYWCPDGHAVADRMTRIWPGRVFPLCIHTGSLATAYTTPAGDQIGQYLHCEAAGYPSGDVNRRDFGSGYLMSRSDWLMAADYVMGEDAPVNLLLQSRYDADSRELTVHVEGYFTADVIGEPRLCVLLLQDNVWGFQNGPTAGDYRHMHMLRQALTDDVWGDPIDEAQAGRYFCRDYTTALPARIGDVDVVPQDLQVVAFVSRSRTDIEQVVAARPQSDAFDASAAVVLQQPRIGIATQYGYRYFEVLLENVGRQPVSSATFELTVGQQLQTVTVDCDIAPDGFQYLRLPIDYTYSKRGTTKYNIVLTGVNDEPIAPQTLNGQFVKPTVVPRQVKVCLQTDTRASQNAFVLRDEQGAAVSTFGPFADGEAQSFEETITLAPGTTYCLEATDAWGDGSLVGATGYIELRDAQGVSIERAYIYGYGARIFMTTEATDGINMVQTATDGTPRRYNTDGRPVGNMQKGIVVEQRADKIRKYIQQK